ncbi:MAG: ABC transporter ATP-binding protein [Rubrivivax sp.]|nr:ABC transporter ATP-binding protein [Rubrivivax sp.]
MRRGQAEHDHHGRAPHPFRPCTRHRRPPGHGAGPARPTVHDRGRVRRRGRACGASIPPHRRHRKIRPQPSRRSVHVPTHPRPHRRQRRRTTRPGRCLRDGARLRREPRAAARRRAPDDGGRRLAGHDLGTVRRVAARARQGRARARPRGGDGRRDRVGDLDRRGLHVAGRRGHRAAGHRAPLRPGRGRQPRPARHRARAAGQRCRARGAAVPGAGAGGAAGAVDVNVAAAAPVFSARGVTKVYGSGDAQVRALDGVDLQIRRGEFIVLLGASGSGKSTLLNILGGLDVPTAGEVRFADHLLTGASEAELTRYRREHVGFVFQFYNLIPSLTVRENVALVTDIAPHPMAVDEALAWVGLAERRDHFPSQLSGGEQQRVAIARAVVKQPDVLLCDEPTGALDYATGKRVLEVIAKVNAELGTTAVVITHNAAIAAMADRVVRLADGRVDRIEVNEHKRSPAELSW